MRVVKWGTSLAVRLPAAVVQALDIKAGDDFELHVVSNRSLAVVCKPLSQDLLTRLRRLRGRLPADFHFARLDANERDTDSGSSPV